MSSIDSIRSKNLNYSTPPEERCGLGTKLWNTYVWNPALSRGGWFSQTPVPKDIDTWRCQEARNAYTVLTTPGRRLNSVAERALFDSLEAKPSTDAPKIKTIHSLIELGNLSLTEASERLNRELGLIIPSLRVGESTLKNGEEAFVCIPVSTPKAEAGAPHYVLRTAVVALFPISLIYLFISWIHGLCRSDSTLKNNAERLWTPGSGHISLLAVTIKNEGGRLKAGPYEYFDSKGRPMEDPENRLVEDPDETKRHFVHELIPVMNTALQSAEVTTNKTPEVIHPEFQFQTDVHNCGFWVYLYAQKRSHGLSPDMTLHQLSSLTKTINLQRILFTTQGTPSLFLPTYRPPTATTEADALKAEERDPLQRVETSLLDGEDDWVG